MNKPLKEKVIVVSGGTKGVGKTISEEFAKAGAKVVIGGRDEDAARKSIKIIKTYGNFVILLFGYLNIGKCLCKIVAGGIL